MNKSVDLELNPFDNYKTNKLISIIISIIIYLLLIHWLIRLYLNRCYPKMIGIFFIFIHFLYFVELILRSTLTVDQMSLKSIYLLRFALINVPFRLILFSQYQILVQLRKNKEIRREDRFIDIIVPILATLADIQLSISNEILFGSFLSIKYFILLRFISSLMLFILIILFYFLLFINRIHFDEKRILRHLILSNSMIFIQTLTIVLQSNLFIWKIYLSNEFYFHSTNTIPLLICLIIWNIHHPSILLSSSTIKNSFEQKQKFIENISSSF